MNKISIFGAGGLLGSDLVAVGQKKYTLLPYRGEVDIRQLDVVLKRLQQDQPDWVINSAGKSNVDECEKDPTSAYAVNQQGVKNLAEACSKLNIPLIQISTDYVFSGETKHRNTEEDATGPVNTYAKSKQAGEVEAVRWEKHYILRVSSLYGRHRDNHATRVENALQQNGKPINVAEDMFCSPTYTPHLAEWIYGIVHKKPPFGIYHLAHQGWCSRYEFALKILEILGDSRKNLIQPMKIQSLSLPAQRPLAPLMSTEKWERLVGPLPKWEDGLKVFLNRC